MFGPDQVEMQKLRTPSGWYLCLQLDDLQKVCEWLYLDSTVRYRPDFLPSELRLPFLIKNNPTEDRSLQVLQVIEFEQAQQVVSYDGNLKPRALRWKRRPDDLPNWIWDEPPWPHLESSGRRQVCLGNAFFCAFKEDLPFIEDWLELELRDRKRNYTEGYHETAMPYLIKLIVNAKSNSAMLTAIPTADLIFLVRRWTHYLGARSLSYPEWDKFSRTICVFIENLVQARWPIHRDPSAAEPNDKSPFG